MLTTLDNILQLPVACIVNKNLTKAFFKRNFELTLAERKLLYDSLVFSTMDIMASIKTSNSNLPDFSDDQMHYIELLVIAVHTSETDFDKNKFKIAEIIQKYIPYPILLCVYSSRLFMLNTCDKRINLNESNKRTVEKCYYTENIAINTSENKHKVFLNSLDFAKLDKLNLKTLFNSYTSRIIALHTAEVISSFSVRSSERSKQDIQNLELISLLKSEIVTLQNKAKLETQLNIIVDLNKAIQEKRKEINNLENIITS